MKTRGFGQDQVLEWLREGLSQGEGLVYRSVLFCYCSSIHHNISSIFTLLWFDSCLDLFEFDLVDLPPTYTSIGIRAKAFK